MKWKYRINKVVFVSGNNDEFIMRTRIKREFKTKKDFLKERNELQKHGKKKYGIDTKLTLTYTEKT